MAGYRCLSATHDQSERGGDRSRTAGHQRPSPTEGGRRDRRLTDLPPDLAREAWSAACDLRESSGHTEIPLDLNQMAAGLGIEIIAWSSVAEGERCPVPGILACFRSGPVIILNDLLTATRQRFTLAHEIGHWVRGDSGLISLGERRDTLIERWCNRFAAELLIPREAVEKALLAGESFRGLAERLNVSRDALDRRCQNLGHFGRWTERCLWLKTPKSNA